jgi:PAS domain S-box-containing protein
VLERSLPPHASSVAEARALVRQALEAAAAEQWADDAQLAVSEVVTNALVHAGTELHLSARISDSGVRVEVADGGRHLPSVREYSLAAGTGRGLRLVADLVDRWGSYPTDAGKIVWFEIHPTGHTIQPSVQAPSFEGGDAPDNLAVELLNFPLLIHLAWQEHASTLLRDFLLASLDDDDMSAFERHAHASEAMNLLHEQVPAPPLLEDPEAIMTAATEPGVSADRLVLTVPRASVSTFETLDVMLTEATARAETGAFLAAPTQPEVSDMRTWLCKQVRDQSAGITTPQPWSSGEPADEPVEPATIGWDPRAISTSDRARLAIDGASIIVAVSPAAVALLGYRDEAELRGHRIIRIVPRRYHQAHIAGTTLHMTNGRDPLLGRRVTVPVVRADGTEIPVSLLVEPHAAAGGRRFFVADFFVNEPGEL